MNIEQAIKWAERMADDRGYADHLAHGGKRDPDEEEEILCARIALSALREKAERENGCVWCGKSLRFECYLIDDDGYTASIVNNVVQTVIANFCPLCGKRLEVKQEREEAEAALKEKEQEI